MKYKEEFFIKIGIKTKRKKKTKKLRKELNWTPFTLKHIFQRENRKKKGKRLSS